MEKDKIHNQQKEIKWSAFEFYYHEKDQKWFISYWIISIGIFASLIIFNNVFGAATMAMFSIIIYIYAIKKPELIECKIDDTGITYGEHMIPLNAISSFWIENTDPKSKELLIKNKNSILPKTTILLGDVNLKDLRNVLKEKGIKEEEMEESFSDALAKRLRF